MDRTPIPRRVGTVRATFALVTAFFLAAFAVQHVAGREPFPALRGPSFGLGSGIALEPRSVLEVGFGDRTSEWLAPHALIERVSYKQRRWVAQALMRAASGPSRGEVLEWFRDALARKFPGRVPSRIRAFTFAADHERRAPARRTLAWEAELGRP